MNAVRRFFFYGTLLGGMDNPVAQAVHCRFRDLGPAWVPGRLFAISDRDGWYPALVTGEGVANGRLYAALPGFGGGELAALDAYEGCQAGPGWPGEYGRRAVFATMPSGRGSHAQAYLYRRPLPRRAVLITGGDFPGWLRQTGHAAFCRRVSGNRAIAS